MKINSKDFRVPEGDKVDLAKWPTNVDARVQVEEALSRNCWRSTLRN